MNLISFEKLNLNSIKFLFKTKWNYAIENVINKIISNLIKSWI